MGIHRAVWGEDCGEDYALPANKPLACVAYVAGTAAEAFVKFLAVRDLMPQMPLFLTPDTYVEVPLERTYALAWESMPRYWQDVLESPKANAII